jgi:hypothetical protein
MAAPAPFTKKTGSISAVGLYTNGFCSNGATCQKKEWLFWSPYRDGFGSIECWDDDNYGQVSGAP